MENGGHNPRSTLDSTASATAATNETPGRVGAAAADPEPAGESSAGAGAEQRRVNPESPHELDSVPSEAWPSPPRGKRPRQGDVHP